ncbi:MAG: agmatinase [Syntrophales bacterium]|nr:agmatinase [Syntrophales bacterium]
MNFGGILSGFSSFEDSKFVVVPIPYDLTSTYQSGSRRGPAAILDASSNMELYDEELCRETYLEGIHTLPPVETDARGPERMIETVHERISYILSFDKIPAILGGEHSISFGAVRAMKGKYPSISVLQLDAHADMRDTYQDSPYSHASVGRRISELCPLVQAGVRSFSKEEAVFLAKSDVKTFPVGFIHENPEWVKRVCENLSGDIYVTVDLDVLDPSVMPATGTPEPGGIYWNDLLRLIKEVSGRCKIRGFDIVELTPIPGMVAPDFLAAKLAYRIMGYIAEGVEN